MATTHTDIAMMGIRRKNFIGNTDKYLPTRSPPTPVAEAVQKEFGFLDVVLDTTVFNLLYRESARERLAAYKLGVDFYNGKQYQMEYEDGERKPVFNYCQMIVDKSVDFFVAKGFNLRATEGNEAVAEAMDCVWRANDKAAIFRKLAATASMMGDAFLYITIDDKDPADPKKLLPKDKWKITLTTIDPFFVFPVFSTVDQSKIIACMIQFPTSRNERGEVTYKTYYFTEKTIQVYQGGEKVEEKDNIFGLVPLIHFPNYADPVKVWGMSDLRAIIPLNEEYNTTANSVRKIIKYHAEPTTVIFGARASKLEKGAKKVWSGLPVDAKVENLAFTADLSATYKYMDLIENKILKIGQIPSVAFQTDVSTSHTSGLSIRMAYQPLVDKSERKRVAFTTGFKSATAVIAKAFEVLGINLADLADNVPEMLNVVPEFTDPLPFDEVAQLDADTKKIALKVTSSAALVRKYNPGEDLKRVTLEILADEVHELMSQRERQVAVSGGTPNPAVVFTSSIATLEDFTEMQARVTEIKIPPAPEVPGTGKAPDVKAVPADAASSVNRDARNL